MLEAWLLLSWGVLTTYASLRLRPLLPPPTGAPTGAPQAEGRVATVRAAVCDAPGLRSFDTAAPPVPFPSGGGGVGGGASVGSWASQLVDRLTMPRAASPGGAYVFGLAACGNSEGHDCGDDDGSDDDGAFLQERFALFNFLYRSGANAIGEGSLTGTGGNLAAEADQIALTLVHLCSLFVLSFNA